MSLLLVAATMNVMAALSFTAKMELKLTSSTGEDCTVQLVQSDELTQEVNSYWAEMKLEGRKVALYAWNNSTEYQKFFVNSLDNLYLGFITDGGTSFTISASQVGGTETLYLKDTQTGITYTIADGTVLTFDAANTTDNARFQLTTVAPAPAKPTICHRYGELQVYGSRDMTVEILNLDGTTIEGFANGNTAITTNDEVTIGLDGLTPGQQYLVKWNGKELIIQM